MPNEVKPLSEEEIGHAHHVFAYIAALPHAGYKSAADMDVVEPARLLATIDGLRERLREAIDARISLGNELICQRDNAQSELTEIEELLEWHDQDEPVSSRVRCLVKRNAELVAALKASMAALIRAGGAIHPEYCSRPCHEECVAVTEALEAAKKSIFRAEDQ